MGGGFGKGFKASLKMRLVVNVLLKICIAIFLSDLGLSASAIRPGQLNNEGDVENKFLDFPNVLIAGSPDGLHEQGDDGTKSAGGAANDSDLTLLPSANSTLNAVEKLGCECSYRSDLESTQGSFYLPDGLPIFRVTVINTCLDCSYSDIQIGCGDFTSGKLVNPAIFRRITDGDCLLNNGNPLAPQDAIEFEYISTFPYPMAVLRARSSCVSS
ncbi:unnamed protein product [Calypogeia fissa]